MIRMPPPVETAFQREGSGHASYVRHDMVQLQVHLHESFLHVLPSRDIATRCSAGQ